jgi:CheY-like chemotaxis protein
MDQIRSVVVPDKRLGEDLQGLLKPASARKRTPGLARDTAKGPARRSLRVLVVDDCLVNRTLTAAQLDHFAVTSVLAQDGAAAVELACAETFDLILMDLQMPVLDGLAATARIRSFEAEHARQRVPVLAYTSCSVGSNEAFVRSFGLDAVLEKPCSLTALQECLLNWCPASAASLAGAPLPDTALRQPVARI